MIQTIDKYIHRIETSCWLTRFIDATDLDRAKQLRIYITSQLVGKERLNDGQLLARMYVMIRLPDGQGILGYNSELKDMLFDSMYSWPKLNLDEQKLEAVIAEYDEPDFAAGPNGEGAYIPYSVIVGQSMEKLLKKAMLEFLKANSENAHQQTFVGSM